MYMKFSKSFLSFVLTLVFNSPPFLNEVHILSKLVIPISFTNRLLSLYIFASALLSSLLPVLSSGLNILTKVSFNPASLVIPYPIVFEKGISHPGNTLRIIVNRPNIIVHGSIFSIFKIKKII